MKVALVVPVDFTAVLCCKEWIKDLKARSGGNLVVIGACYPDENNYQKVLSDWGVNFEIVEMDRHVNPLRDLKYTFSLYQLFKRYKFDYVLTTCTKPNIYGPIAARLAGTRNILSSVWGRGSAYLDDTGYKQRALRWILDLLYRQAFWVASAVWFTNMNDLKYFAEQKIVSTDKAILTKNYIDIEKYAPDVVDETSQLKLREELGLTSDDKVVVSVSRMIWSKGIREFAEAAQLLSETHPQYKFFLVGSEELTSHDAVPKETLEEYSRGSNFSWLGFVEDVLPLYSIADLAVLPSYYREGGYPRGLTEPMAMGKAVIAADTPDCRSPVEDGVNGYLVEPKNSTDLAEKIKLILSDRTKLHDFGKASLAKARAEYDEKVIVPKMDDEFFLRCNR